MRPSPQARPAHAAPAWASSSRPERHDLRSLLRRLIQQAQTPATTGAWAALAAQAAVFEASSYADYLRARLDTLLGGARAPGPAQLDGVRRVLEAILDDVLHDPQRRGDAPADAATFDTWWDCVVGLTRLEAQREQQLQRALAQRPAPLDDAGLELASWLQRLAGIGRQSVLRRAQLLAELLAANGVRAERPSDDADLVVRYQAQARREGLQLRAAQARAALCELRVGGLLRLLAPQHCCALSKVSAAPSGGRVGLADYPGCWSALGRISGGELRLDRPRMDVVETADGRGLLQVRFEANGQPFQFDYAGAAAGFDGHFVEHLNRVAQALHLPGSFLVDRVNSDTDVEIAYLPLQAAAALQLSGALSC